MSQSQREGQRAGWGSWALEDETLSSSRLPAWRRQGHTGPFTFGGDFRVRLSRMGTAAPPFPALRPLGSPSHHTRWECSGTFMFLQCFIPSLKCFQFGQSARVFVPNFFPSICLHFKENQSHLFLLHWLRCSQLSLLVTKCRRLSSLCPVSTPSSLVLQSRRGCRIQIFSDTSF